MAGIFLIRPDGSLVRMTETAYDSEGLLQELLATYPDVLAGDLVDSASPRRWLLISREVSVPDSEVGVGRWSLDHLFLDQDGIPTLVEVKRSSDTRIRREVIGQMLDYAANAVVYWPIETIQGLFENQCLVEERDPSEKLADFLGSQGPAEFWQKTKTNIQAGRIRLVFVADSIPPELRRVVEFLNEQMDPAEVLALEVRQYLGEGKLRSLVPRLIGRTEHAQQKKAAGTLEARQWDEPSFFAVLEDRGDQVSVGIARALLDWSKRAMPEIWWGKGKKAASFVPWLEIGEKSFYPINVSTGLKTPFVEFGFGHMKIPPFDKHEGRRKFVDRLAEVPNLDVEADWANRYPSVPLNALSSNTSLAKLLEVLDWSVAEVKRSNS